MHFFILVICHASSLPAEKAIEPLLTKRQAPVLHEGQPVRLGIVMVCYHYISSAIFFLKSSNKRKTMHIVYCREIVLGEENDVFLSGISQHKNPSHFVNTFDHRSELRKTPLITGRSL